MGKSQRLKVKHPALKVLNKNGIHHFSEFYKVTESNIIFDRNCSLCNYKFQINDKVFIGFIKPDKHKLLCEKCIKK